MEPAKTTGTTVQHQLRIAVCGDVTIEQAEIGQAIEQCARMLDASLAPELVSIEACRASLDIVERVAHPEPDTLLDLLIIGEGISGLSGISLAREVHSIDNNLAIAMIASNGDEAYDALMLGVEAYLLKPVTHELFCRTLSEAIGDIIAQRPQMVVLHFRDRARRVNKGEIVYAETVDHDQVVHLSNGSSPAIRCSSQALFDQLSHDPRFFKAGSSYIVNFSHVRSFGRDGYARMDNGVPVGIPVRLRLSFEEALLAFHA